MKPAPFEYDAPETTAEALALLAEHGPDAKALAGGQSLVPLLALRLARPARLVDLNRIGALAYVREDGGVLCIGAMTRQRAVEESAVVRRHSPLLAEAVRLIGHLPIRVRGTVGGSLAHADPAAELPVAITALDGRLVVDGPSGRRTVAAADFFVSLFTTALGPGELLVEVRLPPLAPGTGTAFLEISRRAGDFALIAVAARLALDPGGRCVAGRVTVGGVGDAPAVVDLGEALGGTRVEAGALDRVAALVSARLEPSGDIHASAEYRKGVAGVLARRALALAHRRAGPLQCWWT